MKEKKLTEKQRERVAELANYFLPDGGDPFDAKQVKELRKKFAGYVDKADKILAIIAPKPKAKAKKTTEAKA